MTRQHGIGAPLLVTLGALLCGSLPALAGDIHAGDRVAIKVLEWLPARGEYREWTAVGGQYEVSAAQTISIPFAGDVPTRDRSVPELTADIAARLQSGMAMATKPAVSVEFVQRASVFIMGGVQTPGPVAFQPGLTVSKAVALAGGYFRVAEGSIRLERDVISAQSGMHIARYQAARSLATMARLESELSDAPTIVPPENAAVVVPVEMIREEQRILDIRRNARDTRLASIQNVKKLAGDQLKAIREKAGNIDGQIRNLRKELGGVQGLVDRGLAAATRGFTLERTLADFEGRRIDLDLGLLQAELQIGQAERDAVNVQTEFQSRASNEMQEARGDLERSLNGLQTASALLSEAATIAPDRLLDEAGSVAVTIKFMLDRTEDGALQTREVSSQEPLLPGDVLQVRIIRERQKVDLSVLQRAREGLAQ